MNPFATVSKPLGQKSPKSPLMERKDQLDSTSLPCTPLHRPPQACPAAVAPVKNDRFPFNIRDTVDWIIGRSRRKADLNKENRNNANTGTATHNKKTGVVSASHSSTNKTRKAPSSETCVADSFDNAMLDKLTEIPYAVDRNEWLAQHVLALFEHVNALCGAVSELCTPGNCPNMNYPGCTKASWTDEKGKRHQFSAPRYIDCVMSYSEGVRNNEAVFPTKYGAPFPADFEQHCRRIVKLLWHCCGHLYAKHWDIMHVLNLRPQTALVLAHMASIARLYNLLEPKELTSLTNTLHLVRPLCLQAPPAKRSGGVVESIDQDEAWSRVPTSKSGSWGGHSAVSTNPGVAQSQTC